MVIYTALKPLIIAGFVLVLLNSSNGHPLPYFRKPRESDSHGRRTMLKKSCIDPHGNTGICMFKWDCISLKGVTLSTCVDGFLFGACCMLKEDVQDKSTTDDYFKYSTDEKQNNTVSSVELITISYISQNLNSSEPQDMLVNISSTFQENFPSSTQNDLLAEYSDLNDTSSDFSTNNSNDINNYGLESTLDSSSNNITIFTDSFSNATNTDAVNNYVSQILSKDQSITEKQLDSDHEELRQKSNGHYSYDYREFSNHSNKTNNTALEIANDATLKTSQILTDESQTNAESETYQLKEVDSTTLISEYYTTSNPFFENLQSNISADHSALSTKLVPHITIDEIHNFINLSENNSISSLSNDSEIGEIIFTDFYETENQQTESEGKAETINTEQNLLYELSSSKQNLSIVSTTKKIENVITKENTAPVWDDYTSLFPSSFHALISQLTSRESFVAGISIAPNMQLNLTSSSLNSKHIKNSELHLNGKLNNVLPASYQQESGDTKDMYQNTETNNLTLLHLKSGNKEHFFSVPSSNQTHLANQNVPALIKPPRSKNNASIASISTDTFTDISQVNSPDSMNESNDILFPEDQSGTKYSTKIIVDILKNNSMDNFHVFCNDKNDLKRGNRTKCVQHSNNAQNDKLLLSSDSSTKKINKTKNFLTSTPIADASISSVTILNEIQKNSETQKPTVPPLHSSTVHVKSFEIFKEKNSVNKSNSLYDIITENNIDHTVEVYKESEEPFSDITSKFNTSSNDEFLYNMEIYTTKNITKSENFDSGFSAPYEPNLVLTTNEVENDIASQVTNDNTVTTSQIQTQQIPYLSSTISTIFLNEYFNDSSNESVTSLENDGDKVLNMPVTEDNNPSSTNYTINTSLSELVNDFGAAINVNIGHTTDMSVHKNDSFSIISIDDFNTSSSVHISSQSNPIVTVDFEKYVTDSLQDTSSDASFQQNYQQKIVPTQGMSSVTFNKEQNMTIDRITTLPLASSSIPVTTGNIFTSESLNIQSDPLGTTASPITTTDSSLISTMGNATLTNSTVSLDPNASSNDIHNTTSSFDSISSVVSDKNEDNTVPSEKFGTTTASYKWNYKDDCGVRPMQPIGRIVGGQNTYFGKWPWQALVKEATWLGLFVKNKCGGVLITSKYVLTAAHCQPGFLASLLVVLGTHDLSNIKDNRTPVIRNVKRMVVHRHYNPMTFENDLALLEMESELEFLPHVVPICLPHRNEDFTGEMAFVTGWGKLTHGGDVPNILQEVQVPIVANRDCQMMFYQAGHQKAIQNNFVCAGYINGGQDSCEGDSGGPLMVQRKDKRWVLVGTVSHGIGCADPNLPGVYMRMSSYRPWIDSIINK